MEKKRILADAFGVAESAADISPESMHDASDALRELLKRDPQWVLSVEDRFKYLVLGTTKSPTSGPIRVHVFRVLPREMREAIRQIAERWSLMVSAAGREPKRFLTVYASSKTKAPPMRSLFGKSPLPLPGQAQAPAYNPSLDMDPRLVVGLFELPRDADISSLVLRFGGECELVWLNDRNALAVFSDMARAATAIRRVDHASAYCGAVRMMINAPPERAALGDGSSSSGGGMKWPGPRKVSKQESSSSSWLEDDAWGEEVGKAQHHSQPSTVVWEKGGPLITTANPWGALDESRSRDRHQEKTAVVSAGDSSRSSRSKVQDKSGASSSSSSSANAANAVAPSHAKIVHAPAEDWEDLEG
jgi:transcriptional repressor NF-X1